MSGIIKARPTSPEPHIGIELEFDLPDQTEIPDWKTVEGLRVDYEPISYNHEVINATKRGVYGFEATLLLPEDNYEHKIIEATAMIAANGGFVDARCGLHVHLDGRAPRDRYDMWDKLFKAQDKLWLKVHSSRLLNRECRRVTSMSHQLDKGRAFWISTAYPTIEVRMHEATLDASKICNWIEALKEAIA